MMPEVIYKHGQMWFQPIPKLRKTGIFAIGPKGRIEAAGTLFEAYRQETQAEGYVGRTPKGRVRVLKKHLLDQRMRSAPVISKPMPKGRPEEAPGELFKKFAGLK